MTSNIGSGAQEQRKPFGFNAAATPAEPVTPGFDGAELKKHFRVELINRMDDVVCFSPLSESALVEIAESFLDTLGVSLKSRQGLDLQVPQDVISRLCQEAQSADFGARNLRRTIQEQIEIPVTQLIVTGETTGKTRLICCVEDDRIRVMAEV